MVANSHRKTNTIEMLYIDGVMCLEVSKIRYHVMDFYENLFFEQVGWRPKLNGLSFESIDQQNTSWIERPFEEVKVLGVMRNVVKDKAPINDGFSMSFFQVD